MKILKKFGTHPSYFRNMVFGAEDSLVSTVGVVFGIATADPEKNLVILSGLIVIGVEALSMGAGAFLSESSEKEQTGTSNGEKPVIDGIIMFSSYFIAGFIPLIPYMVLEINIAKYISIFFSLVALFFLGYVPKRSMASATRMSLVAGFAIFIGFIIATVSNMYLGV